MSIWQVADPRCSCRHSLLFFKLILSSLNSPVQVVHVLNSCARSSCPYQSWFWYVGLGPASNRSGWLATGWLAFSVCRSPACIKQGWLAGSWMIRGPQAQTRSSHRPALERGTGCYILPSRLTKTWGLNTSPILQDSRNTPLIEAQIPNEFYRRYTANEKKPQFPHDDSSFLLCKKCRVEWYYTCMHFCELLL